MESITRTPSASSPKESPCEMDKKNFLDSMDTATSEGPIGGLSNLATEGLLGALLEPSPFTPPSTPNKAQTESKPKEAESAKVSLESYFVRQGSNDAQKSPEVWNTGYFYDLSAGSGDLWKERSVWASHPNVFETRKKKEAEKNTTENSEGGHTCGVLFWGW